HLPPSPTRRSSDLSERRHDPICSRDLGGEPLERSDQSVCGYPGRLRRHGVLTKLIRRLIDFLAEAVGSLASSVCGVGETVAGTSRLLARSRQFSKLV